MVVGGSRSVLVVWCRPSWASTTTQHSGLAGQVLDAETQERGGWQGGGQEKVQSGKKGLVGVRGGGRGNGVVVVINSSMLVQQRTSQACVIAAAAAPQQYCVFIRLRPAHSR